MSLELRFLSKESEVECGCVKGLGLGEPHYMDGGEGA